MKRKVARILITTLILTIVVITSACSPKTSTFVEAFTVEAAQKVFIEASSNPSWSTTTTISLPDGCRFVKPITQDLILVSGDGDVSLGLVSLGLGEIIERKYQEISISGNFICATYVDYEMELTDEQILYNQNANVVNEFYYIDGSKLLVVHGEVAFEAIDETYCTLYYDDYSQVFDKNGVYYFNEKNLLNSHFRYSLCDGLLFGHDSQRGDWFIWQLSLNTQGETPKGQALILSFYNSGANSIYALAYLGDHRFVVVETLKTTNDYDYYDLTDEGEIYYFKQSCVIFDPTKGSQKSVDLSMPILGFINAYSPDLTPEQRQTLNVAKGYAEVNVPLLSEDKRQIAINYYIVDKDLNFLVKYPSGVSPVAAKIKDGYAFLGEATPNYGAALYKMNFDPIWIKDDASYFGQSFNYGRYVLATLKDNGLKYGVLDSDGETIVDFEYDFISPYTETSAIAYKDGYIRLDLKGNAQALADVYDDKTITYFGVYGYLSGEKIGVKNFNGDILISAFYDTIEYIGAINGKLYVAMANTESTDIYAIE